MLSVIIPTHGRPETLLQCLSHLEKQTVKDNIEVIVVNDRAEDPLEEMIAQYHFSIPIELLTIPPCQQGAARNRGVQKANGERVLFIGDDIFLDKNACMYHMPQANCHKPIAVLGFTTWDPKVGITPTMHWLEKSGWQFGYPSISQYVGKEIPSSIQHRYSYTSHISLPKNVAKEIPFREDVSGYGWEDIEWGQRLRDAQIPLIYQPKAVGLHHHHISLEDSLRRMEKLGEHVKNYPETDREPKGLKRAAYHVAAMLPTMAGKHRKAFLKGLKK